MTGSPLSILIAEDYPDTADSLAQLLRLCGHRVAIARTGDAAVELAADDPPDIALLDILLPGLDGWEVARRLRAQAGPKRPLLIAITGCGSAEDHGRSAAAGIDLHLVKPVEPGVLVGVLERFRRVLAPAVPVKTRAPGGKRR